MTTQFEKSPKLLDLEREMERLSNDLQRVGNEAADLIRKEQPVEKSEQQKPDPDSKLAVRAIAFLYDRLQIKELNLTEIYGVIYMTERILRHSILTTFMPLYEMQTVEKYATDSAIRMISEFNAGTLKGLE